MTYECARAYLADKFCETKVATHPLLTPAMICIDGMAAVVRGDLAFIHADTVLCDMSGAFSPEVYTLELIPLAIEKSQYLCTGLDMYLAEEPDAMSSMALVHSRIRRVFLLRKDTTGGGLGGRWFIHTLRGLNHHFRVFAAVTS